MNQEQAGESGLTSGIAGALLEAIRVWVARMVEESGAAGVVLGLSGGVDSAVCAGICAGALGPARVLAVAMPCGSDPADLSDAREIATALGLDLATVVLDEVMASLLRSLDATGESPGDDRVALGNIKARLRMTTLYALSTDGLVVGTGNYSEHLVGYSTKWGDAACDILPIGRLFKSEVHALVPLLGLPGWLSTKQPSAGLWKGQTDEGEMGFTYRQIRSWREDPGSLDDGTRRRIEKMVDSSEHKRKPIPFFDARKWMATNA